MKPNLVIVLQTQQKQEIIHKALTNNLKKQKRVRPRNSGIVLFEFNKDSSKINLKITFITTGISSERLNYPALHCELVSVMQNRFPIRSIKPVKMSQKRIKPSGANTARRANALKTCVHNSPMVFNAKITSARNQHSGRRLKDDCF